jgi:hypothetical protein
MYDVAPVSAGAGMLLGDAARRVYEYEKVGNAAEAVGQLTAQERELLEQRAAALNLEYPFSNKEIMDAAFELGRAGYKFEQIRASLGETLNLSLAGDIGLGRAADIITNITKAMRMPEGTADEVVNSTRKVSDAIAYAATNSNASVEELSTTFKYVAPLAAATSMSLEKLSVASMALANNGIKGSNAGTGLRFALTRMLKPSKEALKALDRLNIKIGDFVKGSKKISAEDLVGQLSLDGIDASNFTGEIEAILNDPELQGAPEKLAARLGSMLTEELGKDSIVDAKALTDSLTESLAVLGTEVDFFRFMRELRKNPLSEALMPTIMGVRHGSKMLAFYASDFDGMLADMEAGYAGAADRMSKIRMKGVVGDFMRLAASYDNFIMTLSKTGVLTAAANAMVGLANALQTLSDLNPQILEFGTYGLVALTAMAPLGFILSGVASAIGFLGAALAVAVSPLGLFVGSMAALAYFNWDKIKIFSRGFASGWSDNFDPTKVGEISKSFDDLKKSLSDAFGFTIPDGSILLSGKDWGRAFAAGANAIMDALNGAIKVLKEFVDLSARAKEFMFGDSNPGNDPNRGQGAKNQKKARAQLGDKSATTGISKLWTDAKNLVSEMTKVDETVVSPHIDPGSLDAAIAKSHQLKAALDSIANTSVSVNKPAGGRARGGGRNRNKAAGGAVRRGMTYNINERGRETVTMGTNGYVTPAHKVGGGGGNVNHFHIQGSDPQAIASEIVGVLDRQLSRSNQLAIDGRRIR